MEEWDKDAANQLRAQAQAAKARLDGNPQVPTALEPYDPMRIRARLLRCYKGGLTRTDLKTMDYREYFGYIRELDIMLQEEAEAAKGDGGKVNSPEETRAMINNLPHAQEYEGEVIKLI